MILLLNLIIACYLGYLSIYKGDILDYVFLFLSLLNVMLIYPHTVENKKLKKEIKSSFLKMADLSQDSLHDKLTGIYNRRYFDIIIDKLIEKAADFSVKFSVLMIDIDHFKKFNDKYGHDIGDEVLKIVSRTIEKNIRSNSDMLFRYGGEEFIVITAVGLDDAIMLAHKINELDFIGAPEKITVSIGVSNFQQGLSKEDLIKIADNNLYKAKESGRNCCKWEESYD